MGLLSGPFFWSGRVTAKVDPMSRDHGCSRFRYFRLELFQSLRERRHMLLSRGKLRSSWCADCIAEL
jgi:hypothetical protein